MRRQNVKMTCYEQLSLVTTLELIYRIRRVELHNDHVLLGFLLNENILCLESLINGTLNRPIENCVCSLQVTKVETEEGNGKPPVKTLFRI